MSNRLYRVDPLCGAAFVAAADFLCNLHAPARTPPTETAKHFCTTTDIWSGKKRSFLGVTIHWIDQNLERKSASIACRRFKGVHSFNRIKDLLLDIYCDFELDTSKVEATVTDNGSNFVKAFQMFGVNSKSILVSISTNDDETVTISDSTDSESEDEIQPNFNDPLFNDDIMLNDERLEDDTEERNLLPDHYRCCAHTLNLIASADVKHLLQDETTVLGNMHINVIKKCNELWNLAGRPKSVEIIKNVLGHTLSRPGVTRWNSLYDSLKQILKIKQKNLQLSRALGIKNPLTDNEFEYLEEFIECAAPVATALDILQESLNKTDKEREHIQKTTILQRDCSEWMELRRSLLTASNFGRIIKMKQNTKCANTVKKIIYGTNLEHVASIKHGRNNEGQALKQLAEQEEKFYIECGVTEIVDPRFTRNMPIREPSAIRTTDEAINADDISNTTNAFDAIPADEIATADLSSAASEPRAQSPRPSHQSSHTDRPRRATGVQVLPVSQQAAEPRTQSPQNDYADSETDDSDGEEEVSVARGLISGYSSRENVDLVLLTMYKEKQFCRRIAKDNRREKNQGERVVKELAAPYRGQAIGETAESNPGPVVPKDKTGRKEVDLAMYAMPCQ
ncbi:hypothetical protein EVAR_77945_1 [Eumeta japonica]|uniref:Zinc finger BED domain-containing protein 4 n=1 Tax=Eumeta variegata TaxID=151549 RepID=A0A4C1XVR6_EUMVA|nr:hypothetical protein EVAR_77945_1 [Eumeta japonica]